MKKYSIYMAGPLFTLAEREHNSRLAAEIERLAPSFHCVLPQLRAGEFLPDLAAVVKDCLDQVSNARAVVACLEGPDADSGTALEVGFAQGIGTPVIGYRTDFRGSEVDGVNAMLRFACTKYINQPAYAATLSGLAEAIVKDLRYVLAYA